MPEAPEIPEATDPFEKRVAMSIAILAAFLAVISSRGDNAQADAIIRTNEATNQWGYYQAKSIKQQLAQNQAELVQRITSTAPDAQDAAKLRVEGQRYEAEKKEIKAVAEAAQASAAYESRVNDRCDIANLLLQIAIVICSVAILSHWRAFWYLGLLLGTAGTVIGITAFLM